MTIDKDIFIELLGELETYYKRELTPFAKRVWYKHLGDHLSTEEFSLAVEQMIVSKQFMPTPEQLVEAVKGNADTNSLKDWELCVKAAARSDRTLLEDLSPQGRSALHLVGGLHKIGMATEEQLTWIKKEFVGIWKSTPSDVKALPQATSLGNASLDTLRKSWMPEEPDSMLSLRELAEKMSMNGYQS